MKKIFSLLITLCSLAAFGQYPVSNISITLPPNPAANTGDWAMPFVITAQARLLQGQVPGKVMESRILVHIKKNGGKSCGSFTQQTAPLSNFNSATKSWSGAAAVGLLGNACVLPPGEYQLCVQFFSSYAPVEALSSEVCESFIIADTKQQTFSASQNIIPANGKVFSKEESKQPIMFRWTPVLPKPTADVQYKLRLVELKMGQTAAQAIRTNTVLFEKEVTNQTQFVSGIDPVVVWPIAPDSKYAWNVQAYVNGILIGESEATTFAACCGDTSCCTPINALPVNGQNFTQKEAKQPIQLRWTQETTPPASKDIMYTVHVYIVEKGQIPTEAIKRNKPIFEKTVKAKETTWQMPAEYANAKEAKTFAWNVRATDKAGKAVGEKDGTSEATSFTRSSSTCSHSANITSIECLGMVNGLQQYKVCVDYKNTAALGCSDCEILLNTPGNYGTGITIVSTNPNTVINTILGTVPVSLTAGQQTTICFNATVTSGNNLKFQIHATCNDASATLPEIDRNHENSLFDTLPPSCICNDCEKANMNFNNITTTATGSNGDQYNIAGNISVTGLAVYGLEFEVQSFSYTSTPAACSNGITTLEQSGMFLIPATTINGSSAIQVFNETVSPSGTNNNGSKDVMLVGTTQMPSVIPFNLTVGLPGPLTGLDPKCCKMNYKVCVRVTVFYEKDSCKSCVFTHCFNFSN